MSTITINEALALVKAVKQRKSSLEALRGQVAQKETLWGTKEKTVEPQYDVKEVDRKITELDLFLYKVDSAIKSSNAVTNIDIKELDVDKLLEPLQ